MKRILVVDDSTTNLKFVESVLSNDYKLTLVRSGEQAIEYLRKNPVDLVLLDLLMPQMNGFEVFEQIKKLPYGHDVSVVFLSADTDVENEIKGLEMGAVDFIRKPFSPEVMKNRIGRILRLEELNRALEKIIEEKTVQVEKLSFESIATIASMIEAKDSYIKGHSLRVAEYSALIAQAIGWKEEEIKNLKYIALLHDIGKVGIPDSVLNKPGKLTKVEYEIIKSHTPIGGEILKDIETIMDVDSGAKYHHERYDGKGYPCGLVGEDIPLVARIICIADAYDAMNSKRIYRDSMPAEVIRQELEKGKGTQFDPQLTEVFLKLFDEGKLQLDLSTDENEKTITGESSLLMNQVMRSIEEEAKKQEAPDYLTGLLSRKSGEVKIMQEMKESNGCLAFIDLDNLKRTNDTMGHLAGDYALMTVGEVLSEYGQDAVVSRIGGDEFLYYMINVDKEEATANIEKIMAEFAKRKEQNTYLGVSSLSVGLCLTNRTDEFMQVLQKADRALYRVKCEGKGNYCFYEEVPDNAILKNSVDLERLVGNLKQQGSYKGSLNVEYREFAKIYDFVQNLQKRFQYDAQLVMITLDSQDKESMSIDEKEYAMKCMESTIQEALRTVDIYTRFGGEQFLIILINTKEDKVKLATQRIFSNFYKMYNGKAMNISYDIANLQK